VGDDAGCRTHTATRPRWPLPEATVCPPSVVADTIMCTIELGLTITDAAIIDESTTIFCAPVSRDARCLGCEREGSYCESVTQSLTDLPMPKTRWYWRWGWPATAAPPPSCSTKTSAPAAPRATTTRRCARYVLRPLMIDRTTMSVIAAEVGVAWHT